MDALSDPGRANAPPPARARLPLSRYVVAVPLAALLFVAVAVIQEKETFLPLLGLGASAPAAAGALAPESERQARQLVDRLNRQLQGCYAAGDAGALSALPLAAGLLARLQLELRFALAQGEPPPRLEALEVLQVASTSHHGWSVTTDETWAWGSPGSAGAYRRRLRLRYDLAAQERGGLLVEEITPLLPDPARAARP